MGLLPPPGQEQGMHRDQHHHAGVRHERREWERSDDDRHQLEARDHARTSGRLRKTFGIRSAEAERQIRELRARY